MAAFETTRPAPFGAISIFRAVQFVSDTYIAFANWNDAGIPKCIASSSNAWRGATPSW